MKNRPTELYLIGGITGLLGGIFMFMPSYLSIFHVHAAHLGSPDLKLVGIAHGFSVVSLILITPAVFALFALLKSTSATRSYLGLGFALLWIGIGIVGHLSQTAPLRTLSEFYDKPQSRETAMLIYHFSEEFWEALSRTSAFFAVLMSLCYGLALIKSWNRPSGYLFLLAIIAFPIGFFIPQIDVQLHIILRSLGFILAGVALIKIAASKAESDAPV